MHSKLNKYNYILLKYFMYLNKYEKGSLISTLFIIHILNSACLFMLFGYTATLHNVIPPLEWILPPLISLICFHWIVLCIFYCRFVRIGIYWNSIFMLLILILSVLCKKSIFQDYHDFYLVFILSIGTIEMFSMVPSFIFLYIILPLF